MQRLQSEWVSEWVTGWMLLLTSNEKHFQLYSMVSTSRIWREDDEDDVRLALDQQA
jgi:hypothetical protein